MLVGYIARFLGVMGMVIKFSLAVAPEGKTPAGRANALAVKFGATRDEGESGLLDRGGRLGQDGRKLEPAVACGDFRLQKSATVG